MGYLLFLFLLYSSFPLSTSGSVSPSISLHLHSYPALRSSGSLLTLLCSFSSASSPFYPFFLLHAPFPPFCQESRLVSFSHTGSEILFSACSFLSAFPGDIFLVFRLSVLFNTCSSILPQFPFSHRSAHSILLYSSPLELGPLFSLVVSLSSHIYMSFSSSFQISPGSYNPSRQCG